MKFLRNFLKFKKKHIDFLRPIFLYHRDEIGIPDTLYMISLYKHLDSNLDDDVAKVSVTKESTFFVVFIVTVTYINNSILTLSINVDHNNDVDFIKVKFVGETISKGVNGLPISESAQIKSVLCVVEDFLEENHAFSPDAMADREDREADREEEDEEEEDDDWI